MTLSEQNEIIDLIQKVKTFTQLLSNGGIKFEEFRNQPDITLAKHGISIPEQNLGSLKENIQNILEKNNIKNTSDFNKIQGSCFLCETGLFIAFAALIVLTVFAVALAITTFAPQFAVGAVVAFIESATAIKIVIGIIVIGSAALAAIVCTDLIKCKQ